MASFRTTATVILSALLSAAAAASAQSPTANPDADVRLRFADATPLPIPPLGDRSCPVERITASTATAGALQVDTIGIDAAGAVHPAELARETEALIGRSVDQGTLDRLAVRAECLYRQKGVLSARATVAPGASPGQWRLAVEEGRVRSVEAATGDQRLDDFLRRAFGQVKPGQPLRAEDLRRGQALAARNGVWSVSTRLSRDPSDPGAVTLVVEAPKPRTNVFVSAQNDAPESVGRWWAGASVIGNGLTPLNEQTTLGVFHSLEGDGQRGVQLSSRALLSDSGLGGRVDLAWYEQRPDEKPPLADTVGTTRLARVELDYPFTASLDLLVVGRVGFEAVEQEVTLLGGPKSSDDSVRIAYAGVRAERRDGDTTQTFDVSVRQGVELLGGSRRGDALLSRPEADPEATVLRGEASFGTPLAGGRLQGTVRGQYASEPLLAYEEFTFGGGPGGRGLDPGALYGDRGVAVTVEWIGPPRDLGRIDLSPLAFVEAAKAWNEDMAYGPREGHVVLGGAGLRFRIDERTVIDVVYAHGFDFEGVDEDRFGRRVLVTVRTSFPVR